MIVYRISTSTFCNDLSGRGAEIFGGRWNKKGTAVLYTGESRALCITEIAVHIPLGIIPVDYSLCIIEFPDDVSIQLIDVNDLAFDWRSFPYAESNQLIGEDFIKANKYLILKVPSAVVPGEFNYLINPAHRDFNLIKIVKTEPFIFDERLFK
jgi:RES domain-containing protein